MNITAYTKYGHRIFHVAEPVGLTTDTTPLRTALNRAFSQGELHLAVSLVEESYLSSRMLALLIESAEKANSRGGSLTVVATGGQIIEVLSIFDLEWTLRVVRSERELLSRPIRMQT